MRRFWDMGSSPGRDRFYRILAVGLALGLLAAACGNDESDDDTSAGASPNDSGSETSDGGDGDAGAEQVDFDPAWCGPLPETVTVTMAAGPSTAYGSHWLAIANGWYEAENLDVQAADLNRASDALPLLASGQIDAAASGMSGSTFNAIHEGLNLVGTISMGMYDPSDPPGGIYVRNELVEDGTVTEPSDLEGMRFGLDGPEGSSFRYIVSHWFRESGVGFDEVQLVEMPRDTIPQALVDGSIDFAYVPSSIAELVNEDGASQLIGDPAWITNEGRDSFITILMNEDALDNNRDVARAIVRANLLSRQDLEGDYRQDPETVDALAEMIDADAEAITDVPAFHWIQDGKVFEDTIMGMQEFYIERGSLSYDEPKPYDELFDDELRREALATIENCD